MTKQTMTSLLLSFSLLFITSSSLAQTNTASSTTEGLTENVQECVEAYDPAIDYFPDKVEALYTAQWSVTYHNHYKVITVDSTYDDPATEASLERYILVQCGTPIPEELAAAEDTLVIEVPVQRLVEAGGGVLGAVEMLDLLDPLVAWRDQFTTGVEYLPNTSAKYAAGDLGDIGEYGSGWEATLNVEPDLLIAYDNRETIEEARSLGVPYIFFSPFAEGPLGSAEQLKFVSLFFNIEDKANELFTPIAEEYLRLRDLAQAQSEKPSVLLGNINSQGAFNTRPYNRIESILIEDAGGVRILNEDIFDYSGFFPSVSLEVALELGGDAEYWFSMAYLPAEETAVDFIATDPLNGEFQALRTGNMFHRFGRDEDYFRTPSIRVDELLADMVSILHPELLPSHEVIHLDRVAGETASQPSVSGMVSSSSNAPTTNLQGCVETYDAATDYFPDKVAPEFAEGWSVDYYSNYKVVTVQPVPNVTNARTETYVLVQCGTPIPSLENELADAHVISVPVSTFWTASGSGWFVALEYLGVSDAVLGANVRAAGLEYLPNINRRFEDGLAIPARASDSFEPILAVEPDLFHVMFSQDVTDQGRELGLKGVLYNSYWEPPLGSAEEIKLVSLFFNREARANDLLAPVIQNYLALEQRVETEVAARPTVLFGNINRDGLFSSQPPNRIDIRLLEDAGTVPILQQVVADQPFNAIPLEFVIEVASSADFWIDTTYFADTRLGNTVAGSLAYQPLNSSFDALTQGRAVHQFRRGTDVFATGQSYRVDLLLRDLVHIFHPELLPDHTLTWFTVLEP
ncbi:MAG: ABC transporter substrate-binding protein [Deinococcota bacterium]